MREMKDSRIEWIGQIPSTWRINKGKWLSLLVSQGQDLKIGQLS